MNDCLFDGNASDAVDIDFGTGIIQDSQFINSVNDGLDISGSRILAMNNRYENNGDKGFSIGEESYPTIINGLFRGNEIGLSTKDLSHTQLAFSTFLDNKIAIEAKRKKPFFGGGSGEFVNSVFVGNQVLWEDDYFSSGQIEFRHSVTDDSLACPTCQDGSIQFHSPDMGDFRLASNNFEVETLAWEELSGLNMSAQSPGIYSDFGNE